jgi:hypothetical protein
MGIVSNGTCSLGCGADATSAIVDVFWGCCRVDMECEVVKRYCKRWLQSCGNLAVGGGRDEVKAGLSQSHRAIIREESRICATFLTSGKRKVE